jgi:hypothetical protein
MAANGGVFVTSTACGAPPDYVDHTKDPPESDCGRAIAAFQRLGTATCPLPDAGSGGEAGK